MEEYNLRAQELKPKIDAIESYEKKAELFINELGPFSLIPTIINIYPKDQTEREILNKYQFDWYCKKEASERINNINKRYGSSKLKELFKKTQLKEFEKELDNAPDAKRIVFDSLVLQRGRKFTVSSDSVEAYGLFKAWCYVENELGKLTERTVYEKSPLASGDPYFTDSGERIKIPAIAIICKLRGDISIEPREILHEFKIKNKSDNRSKLRTYFTKLPENYKNLKPPKPESQGSRTKFKSLIYEVVRFFEKSNQPELINKAKELLVTIKRLYP